MRSFFDESGREWPILITRDAIQRARRALGADLTRPFQAIRQLGKNAEGLVRVLWMVCERTAARHGVTPEQFGEMIAREPGTAECAGNALMRSLTDSLPPVQRAVATAIAKFSK